VGAWVIYDPYWDPQAAYADRAEAGAHCQPGQRFAGCHVLWLDDAAPGDVSRMSGDEFGDFLRSFESHRPSDDY
jgi:hypothetical protein